MDIGGLDQGAGNGLSLSAFRVQREIGAVECGLALSVEEFAGRARQGVVHSGRRVVGLREVGEGLAIGLLDRAEFRGVAAGVRV